MSTLLRDAKAQVTNEQWSEQAQTELQTLVNDAELETIYRKVSDCRACLWGVSQHGKRLGTVITEIAYNDAGEKELLINYIVGEVVKLVRCFDDLTNHIARACHCVRIVTYVSDKRLLKMLEKRHGLKLTRYELKREVS